MNNRIKNARNDGDGVKGAEKKEDHTWHKDDQLQHVTSEVACFHRLVRVMPLKCQTCSIPQRALSMVNRGRRRCGKDQLARRKKQNQRFRANFPCHYDKIGLQISFNIVMPKH